MFCNDVSFQRTCLPLCSLKLSSQIASKWMKGVDSLSRMFVRGPGHTNPTSKNKCRPRQTGRIALYSLTSPFKHCPWTHRTDCRRSTCTHEDEEVVNQKPWDCRKTRNQLVLALHFHATLKQRMLVLYYFIVLADFIIYNCRAQCAFPVFPTVSQDVGFSGTLGYTNPEMDVEDPTTLAAWGGPE